MMNWTLTLLNNRLYKIKNTYKLGFWCLKLIKSSLIVICFCALLLEHENKQVFFKGKHFWRSTMLKIDLGNNISCSSWHGLKTALGAALFSLSSSPWWYTWRNQHVSHSKLHKIRLLTYSRQKPSKILNTITFDNNLLRKSWLSVIFPFCIKRCMLKKQMQWNEQVSDWMQNFKSAS